MKISFRTWLSITGLLFLLQSGALANEQSAPSGFYSSSRSFAKRAEFSINKSNIIAWDSTFVLWNRPSKENEAFLIGKYDSQMLQYATKITPWLSDTDSISIERISINLSDPSMIDKNVIPCHITFTNKSGSLLPIRILINKPGSQTVFASAAPRMNSNGLLSSEQKSSVYGTGSSEDFNNNVFYSAAAAPAQPVDQPVESANVQLENPIEVPAQETVSPEVNQSNENQNAVFVQGDNVVPEEMTHESQK